MEVTNAEEFAGHAILEPKHVILKANVKTSHALLIALEESADQTQLTADKCVEQQEHAILENHAVLKVNALLLVRMLTMMAML